MSSTLLLKGVLYRSLAGELIAALAGDAALSAATPLRTWEETVVPQVLSYDQLLGRSQREHIYTCPR